MTQNYTAKEEYNCYRTKRSAAVRVAFVRAGRKRVADNFAQGVDKFEITTYIRVNT